MILKTTKCAENSHPEFILSWNELGSVVFDDARGVAAYLEEKVGEGVTFLPGETVQVGWMETVVDREGDYLTLSEPDFVSMPYQWAPGLNKTLQHLRLHRDYCDSFGLLDKIMLSSIRHSVIVGRDLAKTVDSFVMERSKPANSDSGWFVGSADTALDYCDARNLQRISLYELGLHHPRTIAWLGLPEGVKIGFSRENFELRYLGTLLHATTGSLLQRLYSAES